jgi:menaquinone-dependent protoporphyrinogen oxidase
MTEQTKFNRRMFLKDTLIGTLGLTALCAGGGAIAAIPPAIDYVETKDETARRSGKRILLAYTSKAGSTGEVANVIAAVLREKDMAVDIRLIKNVSDLSSYQAVIVGSCIRMGSWLPEAVDFVKKNQPVLSKIPTAYFLTCATLGENTPENRQKVAVALDSASALVKPISTGLFGGKMDFSKLSLFDRFVAKMVGSTEGDFRDWEMIKAWAAEALA